MIVDWPVVSQEIPLSVQDWVKQEIGTALKIDGSSPFVVNPRKCFTAVFKPKVVNHAEYITKKFQALLQKQGWSVDCNLENQEIDGKIDKEFSNVSFCNITEVNFRAQLVKIPIDEDFVLKVHKLYYYYFSRSHFSASSEFAQNFFVSKSGSVKVRIGLEFETGNIASSFRALSKLNYLFSRHIIDMGVFVTSKDKSVSTKIWPTSNRNGSLEELNNREFKKEIRLPIMLAGFAPDRWDRDCAFLGKDGRYSLQGQKRQEQKNGNTYTFYVAHKTYVEV